MSRTKRTLLIAFAVVAIVSLVAALSASSHAQSKRALDKRANVTSNTTMNAKAPVVLSGPIVGRAVGFAETRPLRELAGFDTQVDPVLANIEREEINELNTVDLFKPDAKAPPQKDGALQATWTPQGGLKFSPSIPSPILTFEGIPVQSSAPPDPTGAVGPNDYVQGVNTVFRIFDKTGVPRGPAFKLSTLFAPLGGVVASTDNGDPIVLYDRIANRWILSQFAFTSAATPPYHEAIAVSKTGDPTGAYWVYDFVTPGAEFPDYTKFGVWPDAYYATVRQFTNGTSYNGFGCFAFDRAKMLVGDPTAAYIYFNAGPNLSLASSGMIPTDFYGLTPPPAGAPNVFAVYNDNAFGDPTDSIRLFDFRANFTTPANSTFTERPESPLPVAAFDARNPSGRADVEQPPPATTADYLDTIGDRLMLRLMYFNRGGTETLTTCHTVNAGIIPAPGIFPTVAEYKAGTRWYILQRTSATGSWSVQDQGTYSPDTTERWMGSTATDNAGNLAVGYSISSATVFPSLAYAGRLLGDPAGTLGQGEATMFTGTGVQQGTSNRWGDYSNMSLDPNDDATFWYTNEYYATTGTFLWRSRIGSFKFANTTAPAQGTLTGTITACDTGAVLKDALVQVSGGPSSGFSAASGTNGVYSVNLAPGSYTATIVDPAHNCAAIGPFNVTITNGSTTTLNGCLSGTPQFVYQTSLVAVNGGNSNGIIEPNECNNLNVTILNNGCALGANISAVLSSSTPGVTITQPNAPYPDATENGTATNTVPFSVSTSNTFACGTSISFTLTVNFTGGSSTLSFSLPSCNLPPVVVNGALAAGDLQQPNGRLGRNAVASSCGIQKACPGPLGTGARLYDQYTFTNGPAAACVRIATTQSCPTPTNDIIPAAYLGSYDPNNLCTNYRGDPGGSPGTTGNAFTVDVPANATLVVIVQEANAGLAGCSGYTVTVSGLVGNGSGPGICGPAPTAVSRKTHGAGGPTFDVPLPITAPYGVEDRIGNNNVAGTHTIVLTYPSNPAGATASVAAHNPSTATGSVSGVTFSGNDVIVDLTGVSDVQVLTLSVSGPSVTSAVIPIDFLAGDANSSRVVNVGDSIIVRRDSGTSLSSTTFRSDLNVDGAINVGDSINVRSRSGNGLP